MSQAPTPTTTPTPSATPAPAPVPTPKPRDKAHDAKLAFALLLTDWLHGDRHFQGTLMELALALLDDLGDDGAEAKGRLEGMPTGIRAAQDQPAQRIDEARQPAPTKAA